MEYTKEELQVLLAWERENNARLQTTTDHLREVICLYIADELKLDEIHDECFPPDQPEEQTLVYRLRKRAEIRRQIPTRKSVQEGKPDRLADLLEEAADTLVRLQKGLSDNG